MSLDPVSRTRALLRGWLRWRRRLVWTVLIALAAAALAAVPLLDFLGFGFAFATALLAAVAAADLGAARVRRARASAVQTRPGTTVRDLWLAASIDGVLLLVAPLLIISVNALRVRNCDWWFGLQSYVLMPVLSAVLLSGVGVLCGLLAGPRRRLSIALPYLVVLGSIALSLWRFYAAPPVFSYNPLVGYFPGNLYDEDLAFGAPFYFARLYQFAGVSALLALAAVRLDVPRLAVRLRQPRPASGRRRPLAAALLLAALTAALSMESGSLGFAIDEAELAKALPGRYETEHFVIHYPAGGDIARDIAAIAADHEFRLQQVVATLGVRPAGKITSFYFGDAEQKFRLMGARNVYMAKPWRHEIYLNHSSFPHQILRHEIAHVVAGAFGGPIFAVSARGPFGLPLFFNVGLIEGIAVAADWPDHFTRELTPHQSVKAMKQLDLAPPVEQVLSTGFLSLASARSYTVAGSLVRYLLDRHGAERLRTLYRTGGDFRRAYGRSQEVLLGEWQQFIDEEVTLPPRAAEIVRERFRMPSIFERPCPHAIARKRRRAAEAVGTGEAEQAVRLLQEVCSAVPGEPSYRLELAGVMAIAGLKDKAAAIYEQLANVEELSSSVRAQALVGLADLSARAGNFASAAEILARAETLPLPDDELRNVVARRLAALHQGASAPALRAYFWGANPAYGYDALALMGRAARAVTLEPTLGLGHYLLGRNLTGHGAPAEAAAELELALELGLPDSLFVREAARQLAEAAYLAGDARAVQKAAAILLAPEQPRVTRLYGQDWLDRLAWDRARGSD